MPQLLQVIQQGQFRGAEIFALDLSRALAQQDGWRVALYSLLGVDPAYATMSARSGIALSTGSSNGNDGRAHTRIMRLVTAIDRREHDVVQANGAGTLKYLVAARRLSRRPWRLVYRAIGMGSYWRHRLDKRILYRWLLGHADMVVAVSNAVADDLVASGAVRTDRLVVIPNAVEPSRIRSVAGDRERVRAALGIAPSESALLYVGSFTDEKDPLEFVEIISRCRTRELPVKGILIGDGVLRGVLVEAVHRRGLQEGVRLLPPQPAIGPILAAADLFVMPSRTEGMPAALLEAGLAGLPTVAYAVGGIPEVIAHGVSGMLVTPGDTAGLARAVSALVQDVPRRSLMGAEAKARAAAYEIGPIASAYRRVYATLLERTHA